MIETNSQESLHGVEKEVGTNRETEIRTDRQIDRHEAGQRSLKKGRWSDSQKGAYVGGVI